MLKSEYLIFSLRFEQHRMATSKITFIVLIIISYLIFQLNTYLPVSYVLILNNGFSISQFLLQHNIQFVQAMSTFLGSHFKIHQLESRLKKNQYLSNDCLPNFLDALVLKALKSSKQIPKRDIYPSFYHWYILMRQFADRTLDHWLKNSQASHDSDQTVSEVVRIVSKKPKIKTKMSACTGVCQEETQSPIRFHSECDLKTFKSKLKNKDSFECIKEENHFLKKNSQTQKKILGQQDSITEYLMSIKLKSQSREQFQQVKAIFESLKVKIQSFKLSDECSDQEQGPCVRIYFLALPKAYQQLQNQILRFSNVQQIQCKKQRRNQSL